MQTVSFAVAQHQQHQQHQNRRLHHTTRHAISDQMYMRGGSGLVRRYLLLQVLLVDHLQGKVLSELVDATSKCIFPKDYVTLAVQCSANPNHSSRP